MPEGDTILRAARRLQARLAGRTLRELRSPLPALARRAAELAGNEIAAVEARGKHLLVRFGDESVLHTHMMMSGAWHLYRPGERWWKPERAARVALVTDDTVAVCFNAPVVELLSPLEARHHRSLARLGTDLLDPGFDAGDALGRLRASESLPLGLALMRQDLVAGIGNVYKSEVLFLCGLDPFAPLAGVGDAALVGLIERARELMRLNLGGPGRRTRFVPRPGRYWVYGRSGKPCRRCGGTVEMRRQGAQQRSTYFCSACQGVALRVRT